MSLGLLSDTCPRCERQWILRRIKQLLRDEELDASTTLMLSSSVIELEHDPTFDPRPVLAFLRSKLLLEE
jgi:hypothetical protein